MTPVQIQHATIVLKDTLNLITDLRHQFVDAGKFSPSPHERVISQNNASVLNQHRANIEKLHEEMQRAYHEAVSVSGQANRGGAAIGYPPAVHRRNMTGWEPMFGRDGFFAQDFFSPQTLKEQMAAFEKAAQAHAAHLAKAAAQATKDAEGKKRAKALFQQLREKYKPLHVKLGAFRLWNP